MASSDQHSLYNNNNNTKITKIERETKRNVVFLIAYLCLTRSAFYSIEHC